MSPEITSYVLPESVRVALLSAARAAAPQEACGVLIGRAQVIARAEPARNVAANPLRSFEIEPQMLLRLHREVRGSGERIIGYWHSHPNGQAEPSRTDAARAVEDGMLWLIVAAESISGWHVTPQGQAAGRFATVTLVSD